ncbi:MAG: cache domain-containing protein [Rhodoferax sp.]|nr:cache domain-containing protein [Rhodoferax sp.]
MATIRGKIYRNNRFYYKLLIIASIAYTAFCLFRLVDFYNQSEVQATTRARNATHAAALMIEKKLKDIEVVVNGFINESNTTATPDPGLNAALENILRSNRTLFGVTIAYAPYAFSPDQRLHSVFAKWKGAEVEFSAIEDSYDYTDMNHEWYNRPIKEGAVWSKPFWGKASNAMVVTYSAPILRKDAEGVERHIATVSSVISLNSVSEMVSSLDIGSSGYGFITYKDGTFIAHPSEKLVLDKKTILGYAKENYSKKNQDLIDEGLRGSAPILYQEPTKLTRQMGVISLEPIQSIGWYVGTALVKSEIGLTNRDVKRLGIDFIFAFTLFIVSLILYLNFSRDFEYKIKNLSLFAAILTITFTTSLISIWMIEITLGLPSPHEDKGFVADRGSLESA